MNEDLSAFLKSLKSRNVDFIVVGSHAVSAYIRPRFTEDLDVWVRRTRENTLKIVAALQDFGFEITEAEAGRLLNDRHMIRLGASPNRVDILGFLGPRGAEFDFDEIRDRATTTILMDVIVLIPTRDDLMAMKRAAGRSKDIRDLDELMETNSDRPPK
jgi:hypothetical protein